MLHSACMYMHIYCMCLLRLFTCMCVWVRPALGLIVFRDNTRGRKHPTCPFPAIVLHIEDHIWGSCHYCRHSRKTRFSATQLTVTVADNKVTKHIISCATTMIFSTLKRALVVVMAANQREAKPQIWELVTPSCWASNSFFTGNNYTPLTHNSYCYLLHFYSGHAHTSNCCKYIMI